MFFFAASTVVFFGFIVVPTLIALPMGFIAAIWGPWCTMPLAPLMLTVGWTYAALGLFTLGLLRFLFNPDNRGWLVAMMLAYVACGSVAFGMLGVLIHGAWGELTSYACYPPVFGPSIAAICLYFSGALIIVLFLIYATIHRCCGWGDSNHWNQLGRGFGYNIPMK